MVQEGNPDCLRRDGVVCLHPGGTNAPKFIHRQTDFCSEETGVTSSHRLRLSGEIIHHKNAPVLESSEKINPCGVIRLKAHLFFCFLFPLLETPLRDSLIKLGATSFSGTFYLS